MDLIKKCARVIVEEIAGDKETKLISKIDKFHCLLILQHTVNHLVLLM